MIVTVGDLALNILVKPDTASHHKNPESPGSVTMTGGGAAANFAVWISRLGLNARFVGKVGNDPAAELLILDLLKEGVLPETVSETGPTATLVQLAGRGHERSLMSERGVAVRLRSHDLQEEWFSDATWLHVPALSFYELPIATAAARAVRLARQAGARISVDLSSVVALRRYGAGKFAVLLKSIRPNVIFANQDEAALFSAGALGDLADIAVLKLGSGGCGVADGTGYREFAAEKVRVVDTLGAGDAFDAAWCATYIRTSSPDEACCLANKLAARVLAHEGARPDFDLKSLVAQL